MSDVTPADARERSRRMLHRAVDRSQRTSGVQLPLGFLRAVDGDPPLARMLRGGRGGGVRLRLYLCLCLIATEKPYEIRGQVPARVWAELLALPDAERGGARRVADALSWLHAEKLIRLKRVHGSPPQIRLRSATGDGTRYVRPTQRYVSVPLGLWRNEWITQLSPTALALLLALLDLQGGISQADAPWASASRRGEYGFSGDTWTRGRRELEAAGLLTVERVVADEGFEWRRLRNTYWIHKERLGAPPPAELRSS